MTFPTLLEVSLFNAFIINSLLIAIFQRLPLLTRSGWVHAGALGTILLTCLGWNGWLSVVVYFLFGSLVTRLGYKYKNDLGLAESRGGKRGPANVWGSAACGAFLAILIKSGVASDELLLLAFASSFSAKLADTFGSEVGKRWGRKAILISTLSNVPPGTDGAISLEGTFASALGAILMSTSMFLLSILNSVPALTLVALVGLVATLCESLIGALVQRDVTWLSNELVNAIQTVLASLLAIILGGFVLNI